MKGVPYSNQEALYLSAKVAEYVSYYAVEASAEHARERGSYSSFAGSSWSQGLVPHDTVKNLGSHVKTPEIPSQYFDEKTQESKPCFDLLKNDGFAEHLDWDVLRNSVKKGMRNSLCLAIAPTATISNISNCTQSIEPTYKNLYVKSNMGGEYTIINEFLVQDLKDLGLWTPDMIRELKRMDGSVASLDVPDHIKRLYQTAFDIEAEQIIHCAALRQSYLDQSQSLNLYLSAPSGKKIDDMYRTAWHAGLKTTYYLRTKAATSVEKSSINSTKKAAAPGRVEEPKLCSILDPLCESCQ